MFGRATGTTEQEQKVSRTCRRLCSCWKKAEKQVGSMKLTEPQHSELARVLAGGVAVWKTLVCQTAALHLFQVAAKAGYCIDFDE